MSTAFKNVIAALTIVAFCAFLLWQRVQNTSLTNRQKLSDCTNRVLRTTFAAPKGKLFHLVLGEASESLGDEVTIDVGVKLPGEKESVFRIKRGDMQPCSWLDSQGLKGHILNWGTNDFVRGNTTNEITFRFSGDVPTNSSVWVSWVNKYRDRQK